MEIYDTKVSVYGRTETFVFKICTICLIIVNNLAEKSHFEIRFCLTRQKPVYHETCQNFGKAETRPSGSVSELKNETGKGSFFAALIRPAATSIEKTSFII